MPPSRPLILFYNSYFGAWPDPVTLSLETRCRFTIDRRRLAEADYVVFHLPTMAAGDYPERRAGQRWIAWCRESSVNVPALADPAFMARFELTIGYWRGATVWTPYVEGANPDRLKTAPVAKTAAAPAVFFQSSPLDRSGRLALARGLMQHLRVDSYGKLLNNRQLTGADAGRHSKLATIVRYKFTLAFENSIATDYVTEKFFQPLVAGSVPVYLGAPNVEEFAPGDDCYIDAAAFDGPARLAAYLNELAADEAAYARLLEWKRRPLRPRFLEMLERVRGETMHRLCGAIRTGGKSADQQADGLSAIGRLTNSPRLRALLKPFYAPLRRLAGRRGP